MVKRLIGIFYTNNSNNHPELLLIHLIATIFITIATPILTLYTWLTTTEPIALVLIAGFLAWLVSIPIILSIISITYYAAAGSAGHYGH